MGGERNFEPGSKKPSAGTLRTGNGGSRCDLASIPESGLDLPIDANDRFRRESGCPVKILVLGRDGQLARSLVEAAVAAGIQLQSVGRPEIDLTDVNTVSALVARVRPDLVVNAAAYTAVDKAESESALAYAVNAAGAEHAARACASYSIPIIHISTDYVFDGAKDGPYLEGDPTGPINVYGLTKLEGEQRVMNACERHLILRTAWVYSPWGANFVKTMLRLATARRTSA